jgi:hypothetical protein
VRSIARSCLIALLICGLLDIPAFAANDKSLGMIIESSTATLGTTTATIGTTVYAGDSLATDTGGILRLKVGATGQIYLLSSSSATLGGNSDGTWATVRRGTVGFSTSAADRLELLIPEGILRAANGQPAFGQVTITAPNEVVISAYRGALVLDNVGDLHTIGAGTSFRVTMPLAEAQEPQGTETSPEIKFVPQKRRHLVFALILTGILAAGVAYPLYRLISESPSTPKN